MELRRHQRVNAIFPAESENVANNSGFAVVNNISVTGVKIITDIDTDTITDLHINLPPCYSGNPNKAEGISVSTEIKWKNSTPGGKISYGLLFTKISEQDKGIIEKIVKYESEKLLKIQKFINNPKMEINREIHSCNMYAVDFTIGCEHDCQYCHFAIENAEKWKKKYPSLKKFPTPVDISSLYEITKFPETVVYLSPSSDGFAPQARELAHEVLSYLLPKGVIFTISTKNIIPEKTIRLLEKYKNSIEGIAIGVANMNDWRNKMLEPGCPPVGDRIRHIKELSTIGCPIGVRMDPMFPAIDDTDENITAVVESVAAAGAVHLSATYLFTFGNFLKKFKKIPQLKDSMMLMTDRAYPFGGRAFSVSLDKKKATYEKINAICIKNKIRFSTCGCKELRLQEEDYPLVCRNLSYYNKPTAG